MKARDWIRGLSALPKLLARNIVYLERRGLCQHEFTAILPLRTDRDPVERDAILRSALERFADGTQPALAAVPGLHSARWLLLDDVGDSASKRSSAPLSGPLVFAFICDGWPLDVLEEFAELQNPCWDAILQQCADYPPAASPDATVDYLRRHRHRSAYLVTDTRQLDPSAPDLFVSAREIVRALELRRRFLHFVVKHQLSPSDEQRAAFLQFTAKQTTTRGLEALPAPGYPFDRSLFERRLEHEGLWLRRTAEIVRARARRDVRARRRLGLQPAGLRGVHAKHHGLMRATFRVRADLPQRLAQGVFVPGREYRAWVRVSSTSPTPKPDYQPDGRGIGIKLLDVTGRPALPFVIPNSIDSSEHESRTQDFTLVSHPTFFVKDARDYMLMRSLFDARPDGRAESMSLVAGALVFLGRRPRELYLLLRTLARVSRHPLAVEYHSMVPSLLGQSENVKFSVRPTEATRRILYGESLRSLIAASLEDPENYLRTALQRSLDILGDSSLELEFVAHAPHEEQPPVDDPRIDWRKFGAKEVVLATLTIGRQDATTAPVLTRAERMVFNPWHTLADHRPLGSLSRARLFAYLASAEERGLKWPEQARNQPEGFSNGNGSIHSYSDRRRDSP